MNKKLEESEKWIKINLFQYHKQVSYLV
jgi:hypothetical protein